VLLPDEVRKYIRDHGIDVAITSVLNGVIKDMPADPMERIVCEVARHSAAPPSFLALKRDPSSPPTDLKFDLFVAARGQRVRLHLLALGSCLVPVKDGASRSASKEAEPDPAEVALQRLRKIGEVTRLQSFVEDFFAQAFGQSFVDDFLGFRSRCAGLADAPCPGGFTFEVGRATATLTEELLVAATLATSTTRLEYLQQQLSKRGARCSPALSGPSDFATWRARWPRIAMPVFHGGGPSVLRPPALRCCAALSPFALGSAAEASPAAFRELAVNCPAMGWVASAGAALQRAAGEAVKILQADKASAALAVDGIAYGHAGGLLKTLELTQEAVKRAAGEAAVHESCGVLLAAAEQAWVEGEDVYELETGKKLALEQLVDFYSVLAESGWLRMIVRPFREVDMSAGCELLRARRPELWLVADPEEDDANARSAPEGAAGYSRGLHLSGSAAEAIDRYAELEPRWREAGGCAVCAFLDTEAASTLPSALDVAASFGQTEVLLLGPGITAAQLATLAARADEAPLRALFAPRGPSVAAEAPSA